MARTVNMALLAVIAVAALVQSSGAQTIHVVGGSLGWVIPSNGNTYAVWATNQNFTVGDILVFNFATGMHNVAEVTKANYDACNTTNPILLQNTGPANITLNATGEHYFICAYTGHCGAGQKLAINVSAAVTASPSPAPQTSTTTPPAPVPSSTPTPTPSSTPTPTSSPSPSSSSSPVTYIVGEITKNWTVPAPDTTYYQTWAANKSFKVGDILVFNYLSGTHDVAEVTKEGYESCNATSTTQKALYTTPPTTITLITSGEHFFICTFTQHCPLGQKLAINVTGTTTTTPSPSPSGSPPTAPSPSPSGSPPSPSPTPSTPPSSSTAPTPSSSTPPTAPSPSGGSSSPPPPPPPPSSPSPSGGSPSPPPASSSNPPTAPSPSGGSSSPPPPPPPPSSPASSLGVAGVSATLLSILVAFFLG